MFDFSKWESWMQKTANQLRSDGLNAVFRSGPVDSPKPGREVGIIGQKAMGSFENWNTGESDWTIMAPPSRDGKMVSHKWGLLLTDETFENAFVEFVAQFRKFEFSDRFTSDV